MDNTTAIRAIERSHLRWRAMGICRENGLPPEAFRAVLHDLAEKSLREMARPFVDLMASTEALTTSFTLKADGSIERHYTDAQRAIMDECGKIILELAERVKSQIQ